LFTLLLVGIETTWNVICLKYWLLLSSYDNTRVFNDKVVVGAKVKLEGLVWLVLLPFKKFKVSRKVLTVRDDHSSYLN